MIFNKLTKKSDTKQANNVNEVELNKINTNYEEMFMNY